MIPLTLVIMGTGCLVPRPVYRGGVRSAATLVAGLEQRGTASFYAEAFQGRQTANGERYDMNAMTCAHRTLPFGTILEVENLDNGMTVTVRVNDRGPYVGGRIVDLSKAAADRIGMTGAGTAEVRLRVTGFEERED
jgi:rare lipoprotein A